MSDLSVIEIPVDTVVVEVSLMVLPVLASSKAALTDSYDDVSISATAFCAKDTGEVDNDKRKRKLKTIGEIVPMDV